MIKQCDWCEKEMKKQNFKRHQETCIYKVTVGLSKSNVERLKSQHPVIQVPEDNTKLEIDNVELKQFLEELYKKTMVLHKKIIIEDERNPIEKINALIISDSTKINYLREWKMYDRWIKKNKLPIGKESAQAYLANAKVRASTKRQKYLNLQLLLQHIIDPSIKLEKVRWRISFTPKYALSTSELHQYLNEQKRINSEDYLIQRLLIVYGLRINTCASLKIKHLEYKYHQNNIEKRIQLPDSKVKTQRVESIEDDLVRLLDTHIFNTIKDNDNGEEYIFFQKGKNLSEKKRAYLLSKRINMRINESKILHKVPGYKYTSHMFRKTKAYNMYQTGVERLKEKVRRSIGQSRGSSAVESYIN